MKNCCAFCVLLVAVVGITEAGYPYKGHHLPPPPLPPAKIHYGRKPPPSTVFFSNKPSYHHSHAHSHPHGSNHIHPHAHIRIPKPSPPLHSHRQPIRIPLRPFIAKPTPPSPPPFPSGWKSQSSFRAPVVKETFHASSQNEYLPPQHFIKDDDKGPIHTIPAPNLGPEDKPKQIFNQNYIENPNKNLFQSFSNKHNNNHFQNTFSTFEKPDQSQVLSAVLNHGTKIQSKPIPSEGYQVTEDPSVHKPYSGEPAYFAPDPDPSVPTLKVPQALDPYSLPSNGQVPLDLLFQQQAEQLQLQAQQLQQQQQQQYAEGSGNTLTSQDLFHLLNGISQQSQDQQQLQQQIAAQQLFQQQYLQASAQPNYQDLYTNAQQYPQQQYQQVHYQQQVVHPNFHPQYETFNYDEQTQEGAHGSDSFPSSSTINVEIKRAVPKTSTAIKGENYSSVKYYQNNYNAIQKSNINVNGDKDDFYENPNEEVTNQSEVADNKVDYEDKANDDEEDNDSPLNNYYSVLPNKQAAETLATLAAAGNINNQLIKNHNDNNKETRSDVRSDKDYNEEETEETDQSRTEEPNRAENVNMQKGIRVYETTQSQRVEPERPTEEQDYEDQEADYSSQEEEIMEQSPSIQTSQFDQTSAHSQSQLPYGAKLRPKRI